MFNFYRENTLQFNADLCNNCLMCRTVCPHGVFAKENGKVFPAFPERCMECGACQLNCPTGAIYVDSGVGCAQLMIYQALFPVKKEKCATQCCSN